nr:hypothetical protein [uncultured Fluviicola sp.]
MNVKVLSWILIVLVLAFMAVYLFVPKHVDADSGNLKLGKASEE